MPNVSNKKKRANKQLKQKAQKQNGKWSKIQTAYEEGNQTVKQICHDYKIKQTDLYKHAKENNWPLRTKQKRKANSNEHSVIEKSTILVTSETEIRKPTETLQDALEFITMDLMQRIQKRKGRVLAAFQLKRQHRAPCPELTHRQIVLRM